MRSPAGCSERRLPEWLSTLAVNTLIAAGAVLLLSPAAFGSERWSRSFAISLLYSYCIGFLAQALFGRYFAPLYRRSRINAVAGGTALLLASALGGTLIATLLLSVLGIFPLRAFGLVLQRALHGTLLVTFTFGAAATFYGVLRSKLDRVTEALRAQELERERALKLAAEAQLASLAARVHPHFLFNALNSAMALIREDPVRAEWLLERLSALLRASLDADPAGLTPLGREVQIVRDYLEIEATRFGPRLRYEIDVPPSLEQAAVPPLGLQVLVENAIKHAIAPRREGGTVRVTARREGGELRLAVWDDGPGFAAIALPPGHGLDSVQARLRALYGEQASLVIARFEGGTEVSLRLPDVPVAQAVTLEAVS